MEVYFNELSLDPAYSLRYEDFRRLGELYPLLKQQKITTCRIGTSEYSRMITKATRLSGDIRNIKGFLYSFFKPPYESSEVDERQEMYYEHEWQLNGQSCYGLALACMMDSMALSMGEECWNQSIVTILRDEEQVEVRNLYGKTSLEYHLEWLEGYRDVELVECRIVPDNKTIKLRHDHGYDELKDFGKQLLQCEYVIGVINSLPFNPGNRKFIYDVAADGIVEIVLPWTDQGLGLVVKTTGRNLRETKKISDILKKRYDSM